MSIDNLCKDYQATSSEALVATTEQLREQSRKLCYHDANKYCVHYLRFILTNAGVCDKND